MSGYSFLDIRKKVANEWQLPMNGNCQWGMATTNGEWQLPMNGNYQ
jgi:hypothetical protein